MLKEILNAVFVGKYSLAENILSADIVPRDVIGLPEAKTEQLKGCALIVAKSLLFRKVLLSGK